jgi:hypothetical protein
MPTSWVRCLGCEKVFTPSGHTRHVRRTHRASCRTNGQSAHPQMASRSLVQTPTPSDAHSIISEDRNLNQSSALLPEHEATSPSYDRDAGKFLVPSQESSIDSQITDDHDAVDGEDDLADQLDAEALELLQQDANHSPTNHSPTNHSPTSHSEPDTSDSTQSSAPPLQYGFTVNSATTNHSAGSNAIIDLFPFGQPGEPVPGMQQSSTLYEATRDSLGDFVWAPFRSQCDWEFARWAKMRGPTSTAVTELLAIPGVCQHRLVLIVLLTRL